MDSRDIELVTSVAKQTLALPHTDESAIHYTVRMITNLKKEIVALKKENAAIAELQKQFEIVKESNNKLKLEIESFKEKQKQMLEDKQKAFDSFFTFNFVLEEGAGPLKHTEIKSIYRSYKRLEPQFKLKYEEMYEMLKNKCGIGSSNTELWGLRVSEDDGMP